MVNARLLYVHVAKCRQCHDYRAYRDKRVLQHKFGLDLNFWKRTQKIRNDLQTTNNKQIVIPINKNKTNIWSTQMRDLLTLRRSATLFMLALVLMAGIATTRNVLAEACCGETFPLMFSPAPNRLGASPLAGATISGSTHIFASPPFPFSSIRKVDFWIDQTVFSGTTRYSRENAAPYDLNGTNEVTAISFDTTTLSDGPHTITHRVIFTDSKRVLISTNFNVQNGPTTLPEPFEFGVSETPDRAFIFFRSRSMTYRSIWNVLKVKGEPEPISDISSRPSARRVSGVTRYG